MTDQIKLHALKKINDVSSTKTGYYYLVLLPPDGKSWQTDPAPEIFISWTALADIKGKELWKSYYVHDRYIIASGRISVKRTHLNHPEVRFTIDESVKIGKEEQARLLLAMESAFHEPEVSRQFKYKSPTFYHQASLEAVSTMTTESELAHLKGKKSGPFFGGSYTYKEICTRFKYKPGYSFLEGVTIKEGSGKGRSLIVPIPDDVKFSLHYDGNIWPCLLKESKSFSNKHSEVIRNAFYHGFVEWHKEIDENFKEALVEFAKKDTAHATKVFNELEKKIKLSYEVFLGEFANSFSENLHHVADVQIQEAIKKLKFTIEIEQKKINPSCNLSA